MKVIITNIEGDEKTLTGSNEILDYSISIFEENEEDDSPLNKPQTATEGLYYIEEYCDNLDINLT